jgi:MraZ protein
MLLGQYQTKLDEKGRCPVPAKFRRELKNVCVVAKWYEGCLVIVSKDNWTGILDRLTAKSEFITSPVRDTDRFIMGSAFEVELDGQGRFVIPKILRDYGGLSENVVFVGLGDRAEIWNSERWQKKEEEISQVAEKLIEKIAKQKSGHEG